MRRYDIENLLLEEPFRVAMPLYSLLVALNLVVFYNFYFFGDTRIRNRNERLDVVLEWIIMLQVRHVTVIQHLLAHIVDLFDDTLELILRKMPSLFDRLVALRH